MIAPSGVYVVATEAWAERVERRDTGSALRPKSRLFVGDRDRTRRADALVKHVVEVRRALRAQSVPVHAVVCVVDGDWPLFPKAIEIHGVTVLWPKELERRVVQLGKLGPEAIDDIDRRLTAAPRAERTMRGVRSVRRGRSARLAPADAAAVARAYRWRSNASSTVFTDSRLRESQSTTGTPRAR